MTDMGYKDSMVTSVPESTGKNKIRYPNIYLRNKIPEYLIKKNVGDTCKLMVEVKLTSKTIESGSGREEKRLEFDVLKMGIAGNEKDPLTEKLGKRKYS